MRGTRGGQLHTLASSCPLLHRFSFTFLSRSLLERHACIRELLKPQRGSGVGSGGVSRGHLMDYGASIYMRPAVVAPRGMEVELSSSSAVCVNQHVYYKSPAVFDHREILKKVIVDLLGVGNYMAAVSRRKASSPCAPAYLL